MVGISGITYRQISHPLIYINAKCQPEKQFPMGRCKIV